MKWESADASGIALCLQVTHDAVAAKELPMEGLRNAQIKGAPGWLLDGKPHVLLC